MKQNLLLTILFVSSAFIMTGCSQNAYSQFYTPSIQEKLTPTDNAQYYTYRDEEEVVNLL